MAMGSAFVGEVDTDVSATPRIVLILEIQDMYLGRRLLDDSQTAFIVDAVSFDTASDEIVLSGPATRKPYHQTYVKIGMDGALPGSE